MKKTIASLIAVMAIVFSLITTIDSKAQSVPLQRDTTIVVNSATVYSYSPYIPKAPQTLTFYLKLTRNSGTVAGTTTLEGTVDGTNWFTVPSSTTLTHSNIATNQAFWIVTGAPFRRFRLNTTGSGTMNATIDTAYMFMRN